MNITFDRHLARYVEWMAEVPLAGLFTRTDRGVLLNPRGLEGLESHAGFLEKRNTPWMDWAAFRGGHRSAIMDFKRYKELLGSSRANERELSSFQGLVEFLADRLIDARYALREGADIADGDDQASADQAVVASYFGGVSVHEDAPYLSRSFILSQEDRLPYARGAFMVFFWPSALNRILDVIGCDRRIACLDFYDLHLGSNQVEQGLMSAHLLFQPEVTGNRAHEIADNVANTEGVVHVGANQVQNGLAYYTGEILIKPREPNNKELLERVEEFLRRLSSDLGCTTGGGWLEYYYVRPPIPDRRSVGDLERAGEELMRSAGKFFSQEDVLMVPLSIGGEGTLLQK